MKNGQLYFYCETCKKEFIEFDLNCCPNCGRLDLVVSTKPHKEA